MTVDYDRLAKLAEEALFADEAKWALADELLAEFPAEEGAAGAAPSGVKTGLHAELEKVAPEITERTGKVVNTNLLRNYRAVAIAWPSEERHPNVSFRMHYKHRSTAAKGKLAQILAACDIKHRRPDEPTIEGTRVVKKKRGQSETKTWEEMIGPRIDRLIKDCETPAALDIFESLVMEKLRARRKSLK